MNTYQKFEISILKNEMQNRANFLGIPTGIFLKTFPGIPGEDIVVAWQLSTYSVPNARLSSSTITEVRKYASICCRSSRKMQGVLIRQCHLIHPL